MPQRMVMRQHRTSRALMYACIAGAGLATPFLDLPFLEDLVNATIWALGIVLMIGGLMALAGHILHSLVLERAAYPLLLTSMVALVVVLLSGGTAARTFIGLLLLGFAFGLYGRSHDLKQLIELDEEIRQDIERTKIQTEGLLKEARAADRQIHRLGEGE